jgi:hypothetical protein
MDEAFSLLIERFPKFAFLELGFEKEEAIAPIDLTDLDLLYVYGIGSSIYGEVKKWLKENEARRLVFLEDDFSKMGSFLQSKEALEILKNKQVHIEVFSRKSIDNLARQFPVKRVELVASPSKKMSRALRLKILRKTLTAYSLRYDREHSFYLFKHFLENVKHLPHSFYANGLKNAFKDVPAIVCGAGPSLFPTLETLRTLENKGLIIAGGSTIAALSSQGIKPHFGMALDPNEEEYLRMRNSFAFEMPLLYSTRVHPKIFQTMNGPFGYMRSGIGGLSELWLEEELGLQEPLLANFSQEAMSVTAICIGWARFLGCNPILLNGIDLAYTDNQRYSPGVVKEGGIPKGRRLIKKKGVYTELHWLMESAAISQFAKKQKGVQFINTTRGGIGFKGIEYQEISEAVKGFRARSLRCEVFEKILQSPMPKNTAKIVEEKIEELKKSLDRVIDHLRVLAKEKKGSEALAEMDLYEEIAYVSHFFDIHQIFPKEDNFWSKALEFALQYKKIIL